ncbi:RHS repeat-associated core domain-containing protein [Chryseobacterium sp. C-39]|nr:RHS repeat-associated core domain-containing protein [Chryseobacterium muglaense]
MLEQTDGSYDNPFKFNAKELDDDTGLYYYGARYYNPRLSIWYGVDPLAEKFPSWSPYNYTFDNPVNYIDPDGRAPEWIRGTDGKKVTYKKNSDGSLTWSKNVTADTKRIGNSLARTNEGMNRLNSASNAKHEVEFKINKKKDDSKAFGYTEPEYKLNKEAGKYELSKMKIVIFEGTLKTKSKEVSESKGLLWSAEALEYGKLHDNGDVDGMISATAAHEIWHATDAKNIEDARYNANNEGKKGFKKRETEAAPESSEYKVLKQLNKK